MDAEASLLESFFFIILTHFVVLFLLNHSTFSFENLRMNFWSIFL